MMTASLHLRGEVYFMARKVTPTPEMIETGVTKQYFSFEIQSSKGDVVIFTDEVEHLVALRDKMNEIIEG